MLLSTPSPLATLDSRRPSPIPTSLSLTNKHQKSTSSLFRLDRDDEEDSQPLPQSAVNEPTSCIECTPDAFRVEVELDREVLLDLTLTNTTSSLLTYKIKISSKDRYSLSSSTHQQDYLQPNQTRMVQIIMHKLRELPDVNNPKDLKDKFTIRSTPLEKEVKDLTKYWKDLESHHQPKSQQFYYAESKVKCKLKVANGRSHHHHNHHGSGSHENTTQHAASSITPHVTSIRSTCELSSTYSDSQYSPSHSSVRRRSIESVSSMVGSFSASTSSFVTQEQFDAEKQKLQALVASTSQNLESERQEKEAIEAKLQAMMERLKKEETKAKKAEAKVQQLMKMQGGGGGAAGGSAPATTATGSSSGSGGSGKKKKSSKEKDKDKDKEKDKEKEKKVCRVAGCGESRVSGEKYCKVHAGPAPINPNARKMMFTH